VVFTIGYFEIRANADGVTRYAPVLGREAYNELPGDLRVQYGAVIDRTMLALNPGNYSAGNTPQAANIFFSEIVGDFDPTPNASVPVVLRFRATNAGDVANSARIDYEGNPIIIRPTLASPRAGDVTALVLGSGSEAVYVPIPTTATISTANVLNGYAEILFPPGTFQSYRPMSAPLPANLVPLRKFHAGDCVSSAIPGNPGPQANFDPNAAAYKQVIRDLFPIQP
jgi:hypothetical protein